VLIAVLYAITKLWDQPRCPTNNEWIKKMWYIQTVEYYVAIKVSAIMLFAGKLMGHHIK
jgi:hypothetical protein